MKTPLLQQRKTHVKLNIRPSSSCQRIGPILSLSGKDALMEKLSSTRIRNMFRSLSVSVSALVLFLVLCDTALSQQHPQQHPMAGMHEEMKRPEKAPPQSALKPAKGARVKIVSPTAGQVFKGDEVSIRYNLIKGERGSHLHAYVDGQLMGMFSDPKRGTLTGIQPGSHTLELRVVAEDHTTELNATARVQFVVK